MLSKQAYCTPQSSGCGLSNWTARSATSSATPTAAQ
jgi:hypothetical protein